MATNTLALTLEATAALAEFYGLAAHQAEQRADFWLAKAEEIRTRMREEDVKEAGYAR